MEEFVSTTFPSDLLTAECTEYRHHDSGKFQDLPTKILLSDIIMTHATLTVTIYIYLVKTEIGGGSTAIQVPLPE